MKRALKGPTAEDKTPKTNPQLLEKMLVPSSVTSRPACPSKHQSQASSISSPKKGNFPLAFEESWIMAKVWTFFLLEAKENVKTPWQMWRNQWRIILLSKGEEREEFLKYKGISWEKWKKNKERIGFSKVKPTGCHWSSQAFVAKAIRSGQANEG